MNAVIIVLDGFGIGAMPDAGELRETDTRADTLASLCAWSRQHRGHDLQIPHLAGLGLARLRPELRLATAGLPALGVARRCALGYPGADTFAGHQTMMGADMSHVLLCRLAERIDDVRARLHQAGHHTELLDGAPLLVVDGSVLVHDNLESDPGLNWNVSARLNEVSWPDILSIAGVVRSIAPVARVIAVGGHSDAPLTQAVRPGEGGTFGLDTPASGLYQNPGLRVRHLGVAIDYRRQLPEAAARAGIPVTLIGKAADIMRSDQDIVYQPGVDTSSIMAHTLAAAGEGRTGLVVANVQETDLAGHQQDPAQFAAVLERVDASIPELLAQLHQGDQLVVVADHGNDPLIGHSHHTREFVPVLAATPHSAIPDGPSRGDDLTSLAAVGASVGHAIGTQPLGHGTPVDLLATTQAA